ALPARHAPPPVRPPPARPPPAPSPSPREPAAPLWRRHAALMPSLERGGDEAARAVRFLRSAVPLDFGLAARDWLHWLRLSAWLEHPTGPPPTAQNKDALELVEGALMMAMRVKLPLFYRSDPARFLVQAFLGVRAFPADG